MNFMKKLLSVLLASCLAFQGLPLTAAVFEADAFERVEVAGETALPTVTEKEKTALTGEVVFTDKEWTGEGETSKIFAINREKARVDSIPYATLETAITGAVDYNKSLSPYYQKLSGKNWKFALRDNNTLFTSGDSSISDFYKPDYDVSGWHEIKVPSVWQLQTDENGERYDDIRYTNTKRPWHNDATGNGPSVAPLGTNRLQSGRRLPHDLHAAGGLGGQARLHQFRGRRQRHVSLGQRQGGRLFGGHVHGKGI